MHIYIETQTYVNFKSTLACVGWSTQSLPRIFITNSRVASHYFISWKTSRIDAIETIILQLISDFHYARNVTWLILLPLSDELMSLWSKPPLDYVLSIKLLPLNQRCFFQFDPLELKLSQNWIKHLNISLILLFLSALLNSRSFLHFVIDSHLLLRQRLNYTSQSFEACVALPRVQRQAKGKWIRQDVTTWNCFCISGPYKGNLIVTSEFPSQRASNAEAWVFYSLFVWTQSIK